MLLVNGKNNYLKIELTFMKITFAVTTYNRLDYIKKMLNSLEQSVDIHRLNIRVYDDISTEFGYDELKALFPEHTQITIRPTKLLADGNMMQMYRDFLSTDDDILVTADSDIIYNPNWLDIVLEYLPNTDGVLSLYNCCLHPFLPSAPNEPNPAIFGYKEHLGSAGTVFTREIVKIIVDEFDDKDTTSLDWRWSQFLRSKNIRLACFYESYFQHIGFYGQNSFGKLSEYSLGLNFIPKSEINVQIMMDLLYQIKTHYNQPHIFVNSHLPDRQMRELITPKDLSNIYSTKQLLKAVRCKFTSKWKKLFAKSSKS